jgi:hypothetical protein
MADPQTLSPDQAAAGRAAPLTGLTAEDLRQRIERQHSLRRLVPIAIDILEQNPLAEGAYYPGDLLYAVLRVDVAYWRGNREQWERMDEIVESFTFAQARLGEALQAFRDRRP